MVAGAGGRVIEPVPRLLLLLVVPLLLLLPLLPDDGQMAATSSGDTSPGRATATFRPAGSSGDSSGGGSVTRTASPVCPVKAPGNF